MKGVRHIAQLVAALGLLLAPLSGEAAPAWRLRVLVQTSSPPDACAEDGSTTAPAGSPQYPSLLSGYAATPTCDVAGVTYRTGRPSTGLAALKVVGVDTLPAGWTFNVPNNWVRCDGVNGSTLENWDLTGKGLLISSTCTNTTVRYNKFLFQSNGRATCDAAQINGPNTTIEYNDIDLNGDDMGINCNPDHVGEGFYFTLSATGTQAFRYNHVKDAPQHFASFGHASVDFRYNLIEGCGFYQGAHCNGFQVVGSSSNSRVDYNTFISTPPTIDLTGVSGTFTAGSPTITGIALGGSGTENSIYVGQAISGPLIPPGTTVLSDTTAGGVSTITMSANATGSGTNTFDLADMYPIGLIIPLRWASQLDGVLDTASLSGNVIVTTGSPKTVSYGIYCTVETGSNANVTMNNNYFDLTGSTGAFYPSALCSPRSGSGNVNMVTGATIAIP